LSILIPFNSLKNLLDRVAAPDVDQSTVPLKLPVDFEADLTRLASSYVQLCIYISNKKDFNYFLLLGPNMQKDKYRLHTS